MNAVSKIVWTKAKRHEFLWDGDVIASETVTEGDAVTKVDWHFESESFVPIARKEMDYLSYVVVDHLGTPKEVVSEMGDLEWAAKYRTWGKIKRFEGRAPKSRSKPRTERDQWGFIPLDAEGSAARALHEKPDAYYCPIRFQGQWEDAETGLYYNRYRYYEPSVGYICSDPIGVRGGLKVFGYVGRPSSWIDPFGLAGVRKRDIDVVMQPYRGLDADMLNKGPHANIIDRRTGQRAGEIEFRKGGSVEVKGLNQYSRKDRRCVADWARDKASSLRDQAQQQFDRMHVDIQNELRDQAISPARRGMLERALERFY